MTKRWRRNISNTVVVFGVVLLSAAVFDAAGATYEVGLVGVTGAALITGGWLWRDTV